jgi:multidrug efflux pump subunit AcrA (membrane-fusion protein)
MIYGGAAGSVVVIGLIFAAILLSGEKAVPPAQRSAASDASPADAKNEIAESQARPAAQEARELRAVEVVQPRKNDHFVISVEEIATVRPYYRADLRARVAGDVGYIQKNINDQVKKDERLVEIEVPDLVAEVKAKQAVIQQRSREIELAQKQWQIAVAAEKVAQATVGQRQADQRSAEATASYRKLRLDRFTQLAKSGGVVESVVEEEERDYLAAQAAADGAAEAVNKAEADYAQSKVNSDAAKSEIDLQKAMYDVADRDKKMAEAMLGYATIDAPFDGVIVERNTNPGDFIQNATTAQTPPLISVARVDLVTISMEVPDGFAPYVSRGAEAEFRVGDLFARGKVTRYSPSIESKDRTMHVEVDLFNGTTQAEYDRFVQEHKATWPQERKGADDPFPIRPEFTGKLVGGGHYPLLPGMVGTMRLFLQKFDNVFLVPSQSVFIRAGRTFIAQVVDGKVKITEVQVQADDTMLSKVLLVNYKSTPNGDEPIFTDLTGNEQIALDGRELKEGETVTPTLKGW